MEVIILDSEDEVAKLVAEFLCDAVREPHEIVDVVASPGFHSR